MDNHGLDEEGNSTDNRTSSESSETGNQTPDCDDVLTLSVQKELQDLTALEVSPLSFDTHEPSCSLESEELLAPLSSSPEDSPLIPTPTLETCIMDRSSAEDHATETQNSPSQVVPQEVADEPTTDEGTNWSVVPLHRSASYLTDVMYSEPNTALDDVEKLASRLSAMFISSGTFTPGFFERIRDIEQCYVVSDTSRSVSIITFNSRGRCFFLMKFTVIVLIEDFRGTEICRNS